jgi:hypothetical protein
MSAILENLHCELECNRFDSYANITCNIDGGHIAGSQDVRYLIELITRLNNLPLEEYTIERDFIRETW